MAKKNQKAEAEKTVPVEKVQEIVEQQGAQQPPAPPAQVS